MTRLIEEKLKWNLAGNPGNSFTILTTSMKPVQTIFYSWQSDLPKDSNLNAIRQCLRDASNEIENSIAEIRIEVDEATRNTTGSPNIPKSIFEKISLSDIFICDLTTTNALAPSEFKRTPNPNVLIELGYAISELGWERIIMVFNTLHGAFPTDLPFDIDRHRATPFQIVDKRDKDGKTKLSKALKEAIEVIIKKSPLRPSEAKTETPKQRQRKVTISNLKWILDTIHIHTFDHFIEEMPDKVPTRIFYFKEGFCSVLKSNTFHVYDDTLFEYLSRIGKNWEEALSYGQHYGSDSSGAYYKYHLPMDEFPSKQAKDDFNKLTKIGSQLKNDFKNFIKYVRAEYLEIDINKTSDEAFEKYKEFMEK